MNKSLLRSFEVPIIGLAFLVTLMVVLREHFLGGVVTHHLLAQKDLPGFSNWWGLISIPMLTLISLKAIFWREKRAKSLGIFTEKFTSSVVYSFLGALAFGIFCSLLYEFDFIEMLKYALFLPILLAIFLPVHRLENLLGFAIGMQVSFGGVLPIIIGSVLLGLSFFVYQVIHRGGLYLIGTFRGS